MTTVHYQGILPDPACRESLVLHLTAYAASQGWDRLMAGLQYRSIKPIRPVEEMNRLLAQQQGK